MADNWKKDRAGGESGGGADNRSHKLFYGDDGPSRSDGHSYGHGNDYNDGYGCGNDDKTSKVEAGEALFKARYPMWRKLGLRPGQLDPSSGTKEDQRREPRHSGYIRPRPARAEELSCWRSGAISGPAGQKLGKHVKVRTPAQGDGFYECLMVAWIGSFYCIDIFVCFNIF